MSATIRVFVTTNFNSALGSCRLDTSASHQRHARRLPSRHKLESRKQGHLASSNLRLVSVRHPPSEEFNARLSQGPCASWRRWRHDRAADAADAVVNDGSMCLHIVVACKVEGLAHRANVSLGEQWENVVTKACRFGHQRT